MAHDAWDVDIYHTTKRETASLTAAPEIIENGNLRAVLRFQYQYNLSTFVQDMIVYRDNRRIDFVTDADWHESHRILKAGFDLDIRATNANYDIQFGYAQRPTHWNTSWDYGKFEVCAHKWADLSDASYGVALLNDCKYGYSTHDSLMRISLLKSPKAPDTQADMGTHTFTYSLLPHTGTLISSDVIKESTLLNLPVLCATGNINIGRIFISNSDKVNMDAVKKAEKEDCIILRMHELFGGTVHVNIQSDYAIEKYAPCNLLEETIGDEVSTAEISCTFKPFEIKTFKVWFKK